MKLNQNLGYGAVAAAVALACGSANAATLSATAVTYSAQGNATSAATATATTSVSVTLGAEYVVNDIATLTISGASFTTGTPATVNCTNTTNSAVITFAGLTRSTAAAQYRVTAAPPSGTTIAGAICTFDNAISRRSAATVGNVSIAWSATVGNSSTALDAAAAPAVVGTVVDQFPAPTGVTALNGVVDVNENRFQFTAASDDDGATAGTQDRLSFTLGNVGTANGAATITSIVATIGGDFSFIDNNGTAGCQAADLTSGHGRITRASGTGTLAIDSTCSTLTYTTTAAEAVSIDIGTATARGTAATSSWKVLTAPQTFTGAIRYSYGNPGGTATEDEALTPGAWTLNGFSTVVPFMSYGSGISRIIYLTNRSTQNGAVTVTAISDTGVACAAFSAGTAVAGAVTQLSSAIDAGIAACYGAGFGGKVSLAVTANFPASTGELFSAYNRNGDIAVVVNQSNGFGTR